MIEFGTPNAKTKARDWRREIIEKLEKTMSEIGNKDAPRLFNSGEYSVYMTFATPEVNPLETLRKAVVIAKETDRIIAIQTAIERLLKIFIDDKKLSETDAKFVRSDLYISG